MSALSLFVSLILNNLKHQEDERRAGPAEGGVRYFYLGNWATNVPVPPLHLCPFHPIRVQRPPQLLRANQGLCKAPPAAGMVPGAPGVPLGTGTGLCLCSAVALQGGDGSCWSVSHSTVASVFRKKQRFLSALGVEMPLEVPAGLEGGTGPSPSWGDIPSSSHGSPCQGNMGWPPV